MSTYTAATPAATPRTTYALESLQHLSAQLEDLKFRLTLAMDNIAHEAGAWRCEHCGGWTLESIPLTATDESGNVEERTFCKRCAPASYCPF